MGNPIGWFEIHVDDMSRARRFYETVLGVTLEKLESPVEGDLEMWSFPADFESYGACGALIRMAGKEAGNNSTTVYFSCDDCAVEESRVAAAGGKVVDSKMSLGEYGFCAMIEDSEGNSIGLHSQQ